jgi:hypothetical protein
MLAGGGGGGGGTTHVGTAGGRVGWVAAVECEAGECGSSAAATESTKVKTTSERVANTSNESCKRQYSSAIQLCCSGTFFNFFFRFSISSSMDLDGFSYKHKTTFIATE